MLSFVNFGRSVSSMAASYRNYFSTNLLNCKYPTHRVREVSAIGPDGVLVHLWLLGAKF